MVVGWKRGDAGRRRGFVYEAGVVRELPGSYDGFDNEAHAINERGQVAGSEVSLHAVLVWDSAGGDLKRFDTGSIDRPETYVLGINETGDFLANVDNYHYNARAFIWQGGVQHDLQGLDETSGLPTWTYAMAWNDRGQVVGSSRVREAAPAIDVFHPFLWENGAIRDLGALGVYACGDTQVECSSGEARDINAYGVVVGTSTNADGLSRAFVWENGVMRDLGVFPGVSTSAHAINDRGQILGSFFGDEPGWFVWDNGVVRRLDARVGYAFALGENGDVVGESVAANGDVHAFVWRDGDWTDLGPGRAHAVNALGDIIGTRGDYVGVLWRKQN